VRIFTIKPFARFAAKNSIGDATLRKAAADVAAGRADASLGGGLFKQRVARKGKGKSGGFRVLLAFQAGERTVFIRGFAKNALGNIDDDELAELKDAARLALGMTAAQLAAAIEAGDWLEIGDGAGQ
jgi:hypothetical protein